MKRSLFVVCAFLCFSGFAQLYPLHPWPSAKWTAATNGLIIGVNVPETAVNAYTNLAIFAKGETSAYAQRWIVPPKRLFTLRIVGSDGLEAKLKATKFQPAYREQKNSLAIQEIDAICL